MTLHDHIRDYYFAHLEELPVDKQFHFASRLAAWEQDDRALAALDRLRPQFVPDFPADGALREMLQEVVAHPPKLSLTSNERAAYFDRYPRLRGIEAALFRVRHWLALYDIDARDVLLELLPEEQLDTLEYDLLKDKAALRTLSSYAVNFIYLYERMVLGRCAKDDLDLTNLYKIGSGYNLKDTDALRLFIYFGTHCIIADTNFYIQEVPGFALPVYRKMLIRLEQAIAGQYDQISLDNKLEFLVCARILDHKSPLFERIYAECEDSLSEAGSFLVDRHNRYKGTGTSFAESEHRSVLYIMSSSAYRPVQV
jgi:hypothetical protein